MPALSTPEVLAAARAWVWYPPESEVVETERYQLVRFPDHFGLPFMVMRTQGPVDAALVDEVLARARERHAAGTPGHVTWWVKPDAPAGLEDLLRARGSLDETLALLARGYDGPLPDLPVPPDVELRGVSDRETALHVLEVDAAVFGGHVPSVEQQHALAAQCREERANGTGERLVAYLDGRPVGTAGLAYVDGVARLWGGAVVEHARHRGVYRALLAARLRWGAERGARMALVKGRVETSAPVLRRAGFAVHGEDRSYRLPLA